MKKTLSNLKSLMIIGIIILINSCINEQKDWEKAQKENSINAYSSFIKMHSEGEFVTEAQKKIEILEYENAIKSNNKDTLLAFINKYPSSNNASDIINQIKVKATRDTITYSYETFWLYQEQDEKTGEWVFPTKRIHYSNGFSDKTITSHLNGKTLDHELLNQDIATYQDKLKIPVFAYQGCPFSVNDSLSVEKEFKFDVPLTITIESAKDNILWVSKESALPFLYNNGNLLSGYITAVNITWLFPKKGDLFFAGDEGYLTIADSAKIEFTFEGINLDGIIKF
jgi:hypothetical protein